MMLKATPVLISLLAIAAVAIPVCAQFGGGGGPGGGGSPGLGIPLGPGGSHSPDDKEDKKSATERPLTGVVSDADGKPIVGAIVQLTNKQTLKVVSLITREKGDYRFSGLSKDVNYEVKAVFKDHASTPRILSMYDPRPQPVINLQLK